jgi:general secretion pathway protein E
MTHRKAHEKHPPSAGYPHETPPFAVTEDGRLTLTGLAKGLVEDGLITSEQVESMVRMDGLRSGKEKDGHPLIRLAARGWYHAEDPATPLTLEYLAQWLAERVGLPYLRIDPLKINVEAVTRLVSKAYAVRFGFLPVAVDEETVTVATADPFRRGWQEELPGILQKKIAKVIANPKDIERFLDEFYGMSKSLQGAIANAAQRQPLGTAQNFEQLMEMGKIGDVDANDQHIVRLVDWLLQFAFDQRASDIHIEPRRDLSNIRFRIDGVLHVVHQLPTAVVTAVTSRIKSLGRMDVADKRRPQDGRVKSKTPSGKEIEMRLSTMPTAHGEKMVVRIFDPDVLTKTYAQLGLAGHEGELWRQMTESPHGIVLVTGPTGSGKTSTLYSTLKQIARPEVNVCTIEDPIEMVEPAFNQMQVQPAIDLDFAAGVRTLMRQDPDIIMVGEIRDRETAEVAIQAALTGHLLLSTLHTNDAPSAVSRLMDIGVPAYLASATLVGIMAQRLLRTLCPHCKKEVPLDKSVWLSLTAPFKVREPERVFTIGGCLECRHTGYRGRAGIYEILVLDDALRQAIVTDFDLVAYRRLAVEHGMRPLRLSGAQKIWSGKTTFEEVFAVVPARREDT